MDNIPDSIDTYLKIMMEGSIQINPYFRNSASEFLHSSYFDDIRNKLKEERHDHKLKLDIDQDDAYDYETGKIKFNKDECMEILD